MFNLINFLTSSIQHLKYSASASDVIYAAMKNCTVCRLSAFVMWPKSHS